VGLIIGFVFNPILTFVVSLILTVVNYYLTPYAVMKVVEKIRGTSPTGACRIDAVMTAVLDPYTGAPRPDLPLRDSVGYFDLTEFNGLAAGIYDLYMSAPGYRKTLIYSQLRLWARPVRISSP
jgi:hypothetical protein